MADTALKKSYGSWRTRIFGTTWLTYAGYYLTRKSFAIAKIGLQDDPDLAFTDIQLGYVDTAYLTAYMIGQFINGPLADVLGTRRIVLIGMACSILACLASGFATALGVFIVFAVIQGFSQSTGWPALVKNMSAWFSLRERGTVMGWWCTNYAIGGLVAGPFAAFAIEAAAGDWSYAFFAPSAALALVAIVFFIFQRDRPEQVGLPSVESYHDEPEPPKPKVVGTGLMPKLREAAQVFSNPTILILGLAYFCLKPARYAILFWGPKFINDQLGVDVSDSALISAAFELGGPLGVIAAGYASDRWFASRRLPICAIMLPIAGATLLMLEGMTELGTFGVVIVLFILGFSVYGPDSIISGTAAMDFGRRQGAGSAAGFINGLGSLGAIVGGGFPGYISEHYGQAYVFRFLAGFVFVAAALMLPLWKLMPKDESSSGKSGETSG